MSEDRAAAALQESADRDGVLDGAEQALVEALRRGDESAFLEIVGLYTPALTRVARTYVRDVEAAHEAVQETWLAVLSAIHRFEGRSSLKTWLFRILVKRSLTVARKEGRSVPFSALAAAEAGRDEAAVPADRFLPRGSPDAGQWASIGRDWHNDPPARLLARETLDIVAAAIGRLPPAQRMVITLRDVEHWTSREVCNAMEISETNQRVLLHRARSRVRAAIDRHLGEDGR